MNGPIGNGFGKGNNQKWREEIWEDKRNAPRLFDRGIGEIFAIHYAASALSAPAK